MDKIVPLEAKPPTPSHINQRFIEAKSFAEKLSRTNRHFISGITFSECDFQGIFESDAQLVLKRCKFLDCDLSLSTWTNVKFSQCEFKNSSFGQTIFQSCEFRECEWHNIGLSSNETILRDCFISNPDKFIYSAYTNTDPDVLKQYNKDATYQKQRLESTKATISRLILNCHKEIGDDDTFYQTVGIFENCQSLSKITRHAYAARFERGKYKRIYHAVAWLFFVMERILMKCFGFLNAWGASTLRPLVAIAACFLAFSALYRFCANADTTILEAMSRSFDITSVAGYTKHSLATDKFALGIMQSVHLTISIVLYSTFFATVVSRLSRVR